MPIELYERVNISEPGYFSCLLNKSEQEKEEEEVGSYHGDESEEEEEPSMLSKSQHFKAGSLAPAPGISSTLLSTISIYNTEYRTKNTILNRCLKTCGLYSPLHTGPIKHPEARATLVMNICCKLLNNGC